MMNNHQAHYWLGMVRDTMGIRPVADSAHYVLEIETKSLVRMREWVTQHRVNRDVPLIAIAPAAAYGPAKEWPPVRFSALIDVLADHYHAECVLIGSTAERAQCERIAATAASGAIIAAGETNVAELIALLSLCDGFAGNDSGAMHLAAALGIPTVGIFGSTDPCRTGPTGAKAGFIFHRIECAPCFARTCRFGHYECLRRVSAEEVANALATLGACTNSASKI
jgi:heptosyltransferase-2